ncbi:MAG: Trehalose/maltose import ATP-binding protein MalK [Methanoregulaceae archaeon PtaU1.Bin059]|nr:MAG: Trehalose/maltose import ATP-binding protein MalK [Methanoregulaceae archaeon PtaB.Bin152]OPY42429.1 MAG: Trehalose/maltose import ATP-binding protein MalK [Methanoregulaceae archaeon PtaU1.Bin059]
MIAARNITKCYGTTTALDHVSFDLDRGQIFGIIGHNGAGKTTLLKILAGLVEPSSGELVVDGVDILRNPDGMKQMTGYLPEESRLYEAMKVDEYLAFFGEIYGMDRLTIKARSRELLEWLALEPNGKKMGEFSKGMKRKAAIARSLMHDPSLLIYDEATSGLDPMTSRHIVDFLKDLRERGKTIVLSAHNLYQVEAICDRILILRRGARVAFGSMQELREMFGSIFYFIYFTIGDITKVEGLASYVKDGGYFRAKATSVEEMGRISNAIVTSGGAVERIESHYPSLEEMLVKIGA